MHPIHDPSCGHSAFAATKPDTVEPALRRLFGTAPPALVRQVRAALAQAVSEEALQDDPPALTLHARPAAQERPE